MTMKLNTLPCTHALLIKSVKTREIFIIKHLQKQNPLGVKRQNQDENNVNGSLQNSDDTRCSPKDFLCMDNVPNHKFKRGTEIPGIRSEANCRIICTIWMSCTGVTWNSRHSMCNVHEETQPDKVIPARGDVSFVGNTSCRPRCANVATRVYRDGGTKTGHKTLMKCMGLLLNKNSLGYKAVTFYSHTVTCLAYKGLKPLQPTGSSPFTVHVYKPGDEVCSLNRSEPIGNSSGDSITLTQAKYTVQTEPISDSSDDGFTLTHTKYTVQTEPITDASSDDDILLDLLKKQNENVSGSELRALRNPVDISDFMDNGGPCQVGCNKRMINKSDTMRFAPVSEELLKESKRPIIPENTLKKNKWAYNIFTRWRKELVSQDSNECEVFELLRDSSKELQDFSDEEINRILCMFVIALRKEDGQEYKSDSVLAMVCGIQRHLRCSDRAVDFFNDDTFSDLKVTLDNRMQRICAKGIGLQRRQASVISDDSENMLWDKGLLGTDTPQSLLDTIFWTIGINFGLRGGDEHRRLTFRNFDVKSDSAGEKYLEYTESVSKTYRGGLKHRNTDPHCARAYAKPSDTKKCPVLLFETYKMRLPHNRDPDVFYFRPLVKPKSDVWYANQAVGHNKLEGTVRRFMSSIGVCGYYTNHSLRASTATRLFQAGVSEQVIKEQTGHRSLAVEAYKRTSDAQKRKVSEILQMSAELPKTNEERVSESKIASRSSAEGAAPVFYNCSNVTLVNYYQKE